MRDVTVLSFYVRRIKFDKTYYILQFRLAELYLYITLLYINLTYFECGRIISNNIPYNY